MLNLSYQGYRYSYYLHAAALVFVALPIAFFVNTISSQNKDTIKVNTISIDDYKKLALPYVIDTKSNLGKSEARQPIKNKEINLNTKQTSKLQKKQPPKKTLPKQAKAVKAEKPPTLNDNLNELIDKTALENAINGLAHIEEKTPKADDANFNLQGTGKTTITIKELILLQVNSCWNEFHSDDEAAKDLVVMAMVDYRNDGSVIGIIIKDRAFRHAATREAYKQMVSNAKTAIINCSPLHGLNAATYPQWRKMQFNFRHKSTVTATR